MGRQLAGFTLRLVLNAFGLWVAVRLFGTGTDSIEIANNPLIFLVAGLIFSIINAVLKPIVIILSLPAILLTLGLFTIIVNGLMVYISLKLTPGLSMTFGYSILTGLVMSLVNYIVSSLLVLDAERRGENKRWT